MTTKPERGDLSAGLIEAVSATRPDADISLLLRAYRAAEHWHRGQVRKSGAAYITHPVAVAVILATAGADDETICAGLLHDVLESSGCTSETLRADFGGQIASLVSGAAEGSLDREVQLIKLADRLHNMRTIRHLPPGRQVDRSLETLQIQVPAARALGADWVCAELADLASATIRRHCQPPGLAGRLLCACAAILPGSGRARWREEWLAELHQLPTRRSRARFAGQMVAGVVRMAGARLADGGASRRGLGRRQAR